MKSDCDSCAEEALFYLRGGYGGLVAVFDSAADIEFDVHANVSVGEAMVKIVVGQMLSRSAAQSIYLRVSEKKSEQSLQGSWQLDADALRNSGLSGRKVKTIKLFGEYYDEHREEVEAWRLLEHGELRKVVSEHWGISNWSADILAIFYFGLPDVFPTDDGTIKRAVKACNDQFGVCIGSASVASPYKTYLSRCLWHAVDVGVLV